MLEKKTASSVWGGVFATVWYVNCSLISRQYIFNYLQTCHLCYSKFMSRKLPIYVSLFALGLVLVWYFWGNNNKIREVDIRTENGQRVVVRDVELAWEEKGAKVPLSDIFQGCLGGKDCIPAIDNPVFESVSEADEWLRDGDRMFVLNYEGIVKVYPQRIMNWHEIVNDWFGETPISVTFCPLCGSAIAFERRVDGVITEFGVSGKLHNNDLVMYDRYEGSLWQQITGEAIVGPAARRDEELQPLLLSVLDWSKVKERYPESQVLTRDTGFSRDYGRYPYGSYESDDSINFPLTDDKDERLQLKENVWGVEVGGSSHAVTEAALSEAGKITVVVGGEIITYTYDNGNVTVSTSTGEEIIPLRMFWFAWAAFHPDTDLSQ